MKRYALEAFSILALLVVLCGCAGTPLTHLPTVGHRGLAPWPQKVGRK